LLFGQVIGVPARVQVDVALSDLLHHIQGQRHSVLRHPVRDAVGRNRDRDALGQACGSVAPGAYEPNALHEPQVGQAVDELGVDGIRRPDDGLGIFDALRERVWLGREQHVVAAQITRRVFGKARFERVEESYAHSGCFSSMSVKARRGSHYEGLGIGL
jgi:hypothetical protein